MGREPSTGDLGVTHHLPLKFLIPENLKTPQGMCAMLVYGEIGADPSCVPSFSSLAAAELGICSVRSSSLISGQP